MPNPIARTVFFVSDSTGLTAEALGHSLLTQFENVEFKQIRIPFLDHIDKAREALARINAQAETDGIRPIVFTTLVNQAHAEIVHQADAYSVSFFESFLAPLEKELGAKSTHTVGRSQQVAFSTTFFVSEVKAMVPVELAGKSLKDMANKRVVTTIGSTADRLIKQASMSRGVSIRSFVGRSQANSMEMLAKGEADVYVADDAALLGVRSGADNPEKFALLDDSYSVEPYGLILPKDDPQFKQLVDGVLIGLMKSGQMEKIYNAWFMSPIPPKDRNLNYPLSPLNKAAYANPNDRPVN